MKMDILITKIIMITVYEDVDTDDHLCYGLSPILTDITVTVAQIQKIKKSVLFFLFFWIWATVTEISTSS